MNIGIEHHTDQFNVTLTNPGQSEPFITIKGCRIAQGSNGPFVSWPSKKNPDTGKYWNHVYASRAFGDAVLSAYNRSMAGLGQSAPPARQRPPAPPPNTRQQPPAADPRDDDIPF